ncbi:hypothetical protein BDY21DRAFT_354606 [Lineolata rhizophorae]|uniref:DUF8032 domain-containing protein n=1 Tax=Lineolata rhizophorae TaxID=578093 RepID=A0A6A6NRL8_9PEZI|nr:hypothetical protein BDY21DRAFT_354606 [Lineolata rhizophorae]
MHHPHPSPQGPPPPQHLQHSRSGVVQQSHPNSPHPPQPHPPPQGPYASPHHSTSALPQQHQSPYVGGIPGPPHQQLAHQQQQQPQAQTQPQPQQQEVPYYAHPSPYSTGSGSGSYSASEQSELMATAAMNRQYPPPPIYHTPQSNSPASVQSPTQHDQHGRPLYSQAAAPMQQYMQYPPYTMAPGPYPQHPGAQQHPSLPSGSMMQQLSHQPGQPMPPQGSHPHTPGLGSPRSKMTQTPQQRPPSGLGAPQQTPTGPPTGTPNMQHPGTPQGPGGVNANAAPGPIPATTPLVVRQDQNGVQWIAFEYSRDRVKMEYTIRCDVESVNVDELPQEFKTENCVYPRACCHKDQYKGNRLHYETECNTVGWALAQLNPCLRGKRGLIQRAVDSWRNSNQDPRLRSRRVRRMAKMNNRKTAAAQHGSHMGGPSGPGAAGVPNSAGLAAAGPGGPRQPAMSMSGQMHHHHEHPGPGPGGDDVTAPNGQGTASPNDVRQAQNFYPSYPPTQAVGATMPPIHDGMGHTGAHAPARTSTAASLSKEQEEDQNLALFGDVPADKRRKFILVDDAQRGTRVRVKVMLDQVQMQEMPDSYLKSNSVYPRSYFPTQMQSPPPSRHGSRFFDDDDDNEEEGSSGTTPTTGRTLVAVPISDGSDAKVPFPRMSRAKRNKEVTLNNLGYRMSWSQSRVFSGRTLFLQRSLDAYRNKMRNTMVARGQDVTTVAPHFETRVGKRKWLERSKKAKGDSLP